MAGRSNVIEYVFQGDTLDLEEAIKRVTKLVNASNKNFKKFQDGLITPSQQEQLKRVKRLRNELKSFVGPDAERAMLNDKDLKRQVDARAKQAINDAISLHKKSLKLDDKEFDQQREHQKVLTADQAAFYSSMAGQLKGESQAGQLARMANIVKPTIGEEQYQNILNTVNAFELAQQKFEKGIITQEELAEATRDLDTAYKNYSTTLQRVKVNQKEANKGPEKRKNLLELLFGKLKSVSLYRIARLAVQAILSQLRVGFEAIAKKSGSFNDTMSQLVSTFKYVANQLSAVLAPTLKIITPILNNVGEAISDVTNKMAAMMAVFAGDDSVVIASYHLEDYVENLKKASKGVKGIDELNVLTTDETEKQFKEVTTESILGTNTEGLKSIAEFLKSVSNLVGNVLGPVLGVVNTILDSINDTVGALFTALNPLIQLVFSIVGYLASVVGGVLSSLIKTILVPIVNWIANIIGNLKLLIPLVTSLLTLFALFKTTQLVSTLASFSKGFIQLATAIGTTIKTAITWIAQQVVLIVNNIKGAVSAWVAAGAYWKLALAIAAAAGVAAVAVIGTILIANSMGQRAASASLGNEPHMAKGGVVKRPTLAMVGEGSYNEAVIPLDNSPQFSSMKEEIANRVVSALGSNSGNNRPIVLQVNGRELARTILPDLNYAQPQTGMKLRRS